jgi:hypothetical protein
LFKWNLQNSAHRQISVWQVSSLEWPKTERGFITIAFQLFFGIRH